jgi:hypothetical protein
MGQEEYDKVDTVPPPAGEEDAYSAPTRLGAAPPPEILAEMHRAAQTGRPMKPIELPRNSTPPRSDESGSGATDAEAPSSAVAARAVNAAAAENAIDTEPRGGASLGRATFGLFALLAVVTTLYALVAR